MEERDTTNQIAQRTGLKEDSETYSKQNNYIQLTGKEKKRNKEKVTFSMDGTGKSNE